ncbi:MAG: hypothetical protein ACO3CU_12060, partial [Candidatus Nanopelagicales bacterium]
MALITAAVAAWALWPGQDNAVRLGLDLRGGTQVILQPKAVQEGASITADQLAQTVQIIRQRVDGVGVAEIAEHDMAPRQQLGIRTEHRVDRSDLHAGVDQRLQAAAQR